MYLDSLSRYPCELGSKGINFASYNGSSTILGDYGTESGNDIYLEVNHHFVNIVDQTDPKIHMQAVISPGGVVQFSMRTRRMLWHHPDFFAAQFIEFASDHFEENGIGIIAWLTDWGEGSDNSRAYQQELRISSDPEQAAWKTWSGKLASKLGYNHVSAAHLLPEKAMFRFEK